MRRGDIWLVDFEPARGREANKRRPAVVVTNNRANMAIAGHGDGLITVVPLTTNISNV